MFSLLHLVIAQISSKHRLVYTYYSFVLTLSYWSFSQYEEYGEEFVDMLDGMFAFVLLDTRDKSFIAARDAIGICPLYMGWGLDGMCTPAVNLFTTSSSYWSLCWKPGGLIPYFSTKNCGGHNFPLVCLVIPLFQWLVSASRLGFTLILAGTIFLCLINEEKKQCRIIYHQLPIVLQIKLKWKGPNKICKQPGICIVLAQDNLEL